MPFAAPPIPSPLRRIAVLQPPMAWTGERNTRRLELALAWAAQAGAQLCLAPELMLTGFHRHIRSQAQPPRVAGWLQRVQAACARHRIAASVGAPRWQGGQVFNSQAFIAADGQLVGWVDKNGLTPAEATCFAAGQGRPLLAWPGPTDEAAGGWVCSAVICREIHDGDAVAAQLQPALAAAEPCRDRAPLLVWPGLMGPEPGTEAIDPPPHVQDAQRLAARLGCWVLQANWAQALNDPSRSAQAGRGAVLSPAGELLHRWPAGEPGIGLLVLPRHTPASGPMAPVTSVTPMTPHWTAWADLPGADDASDPGPEPDPEPVAAATPAAATALATALPATD